MKMWICNNCKYIHQGEKAPRTCPRCGSKHEEFDLMPVVPSDVRAKSLKPTDYILINGSVHRNHNTRLMLEIAAEMFREQNKSYQIINLTEYRIDPCWHCYSMQETLCRMPCQNQDDGMKYIYPLLYSCKGLIIASPINWNNLSAILKHFLDRLTAVENMSLIDGSTPMLGKVCGVIVNGHNDGAYKTGFDIMIYLLNLGCVLAPFGITYTTHGRTFKPESDQDFFKSDGGTKEFVQAVAKNVISFSEMKFDYSKIIPAGE